jgi:hypothetical protein
MAPVSFTRTARVPPVPTSMPRTAMARLLGSVRVTN